ncbi:MAG: metallophosphoesterase [Lentisphaeria bacterium]|nr:metallophosphoesterase [Lentisphaeria bacterium]
MSDIFTHSVTTEKKPWTHLNFGDRNGKDFSFGIISDRTGRPTPGVFEGAIEKFNRMRPDFVISVGDFIEGGCMEDFSASFLQKQWDYIKPEIEKSVQPFFYVAGNHDYAPPGAMAHSCDLWNSMFGVSYYYFIYKETLFICLNSSYAASGIGEEQLQWALKVIKENVDVRWTFVFLHKPACWLEEEFAQIEEALYERNYTVISGDKHAYTKYVRNGRKYFMLGTSGGGDTIVAQGKRGVNWGEFDHITWVSMCGDRPEFTNIALDGIYDENVVTTEKITWLTAKYFRANKKITPEEAARLRAKGIDIEEPEFVFSGGYNW